jgi:hypothetical protein
MADADGNGQNQGILRVMRTAGGLAHLNALRKTIRAAKVVQLTFLDDHCVLKNIPPSAPSDRETSWANEGTLYVELAGGAHWKSEPAVSFPVSLTKSTTLSIALAIDVDSPDTDPIDCQISGTAVGTSDLSSADESLQFAGAVILGGSATAEVVVIGANPLPNEVFDCPDFEIEWTAQVAGRSLSMGRTGPHHLYVTYDRPNVGGLPQVSPLGVFARSRWADVPPAGECFNNFEACLKLTTEDGRTHYYGGGVHYYRWKTAQDVIHCFHQLVWRRPLDHTPGSVVTEIIFPTKDGETWPW